VTSEAQDEEDLSRDDPEIVQLMFDFLYLQSYDHRPSAGNQSCCNLVSHVRLYAIGEKYGIPHLKEAARKRFDDDVEKEIASEIFVEAAKLGFTTTPDSDRGLRQSIVRVMLGNAMKLRNNEEVNNLVLSNADLALELWKATTALPGGPVCLRCSTTLVRRCRWCNEADVKQNCFVSCECDLVNHPDQECVKHRGALFYDSDI
jgi:hypothetical protein